MLDDEPFTFRALAAIAIGVAGVVLISADQLHLAGRRALLGCAAVTLGAACVGFAYVFVKRHRDLRIKPEVLTCGQMLCAAGPMLAFAAAREGNPFGLHWTPLAVACLLYLALAGSVGATWLNYWLLERMSADRVTIDGARRAADRGAARRRVPARAGHAGRGAWRRARPEQHFHDHANAERQALNESGG